MPRPDCELRSRSSCAGCPRLCACGSQPIQSWSSTNGCSLAMCHYRPATLSHHVGRTARMPSRRHAVGSRTHSSSVCSRGQTRRSPLLPLRCARPSLPPLPRASGDPSDATRARHMDPNRLWAQTLSPSLWTAMNLSLSMDARRHGPLGRQSTAQRGGERLRATHLNTLDSTLRACS